ELGQPFRNDATNEDVRFTRSRLRHELLPRLAADYNPQIREALLRLGGLAGEAQSVIEALVSQLADAAVKVAPSGEVEVDLRRTVGEPRYLLRELMVALWKQQNWPLQSMGFVEWDQLADMAAQLASPTKRVFPGRVIVE